MLEKDIKTTVSNFEYDPEAQTDLTVALKSYADSIKKGIRFCCPAVVVDYNYETHVATVLPMIKYGYRDSEIKYLKRQEFSVRVIFQSHHGITINHPVYVGDTGWVISSDWDTSILKQKNEVTTSVLGTSRSLKDILEKYVREPNTYEVHKLEQGFFIPDCWGQFASERIKETKDIYGNMGIGNGSFYIGSSIPTTDELQDGEELYDKNDSWSISGNKWSLMIAGGAPKDQENRNQIIFDGGTLNIKQITKEDGTTDVYFYDGMMYFCQKPKEGDNETGMLQIYCRDGDLDVYSTKGDFTFRTQEGSFENYSKKGDYAIRLLDGNIWMYANNGSIDLSSDSGMRLECKGGNISIAATSGDENKADINILAYEDLRLLANEICGIGNSKYLGLSGKETHIHAGHLHIYSDKEATFSASPLIFYTPIVVDGHYLENDWVRNTRNEIIEVWKMGKEYEPEESSTDDDEDSTED